MPGVVKPSVMKMKLIFTLLLLGLLLLHGSAQPPSAIRLITLQECIDLAIGNSPKIQNSILEQQRLRYQYRETVGKGLPEIQFSGSFDDFVNLPTQLIPGEFFGRPGEMIPVQFGTTYNITGALEASQLIYNQSYLVGLQMARKMLERNTLETERTKIDVAATVSTGFYLAQIANQQIRNLKDNLEKLNRLYTISRSQFEMGFIKKVDVDRIRVNQLNLQTQIDNLEVQYRQLLSMQKYYMGLPEEQELMFPDSIDVETVLPSPEINLDNHIDIRMLEKQKQIIHTSLQMNRSEYYPSLILIGSVNYTNQSNDFYLFGKPTDWFNTSMFGLRLNVPIFSGLQKRSRVNQTKVQMSQLQVTESDTRRILSVQAVDAARKYRNSITTEQRQRENVLLAQNVYAVSQDQYQKGLISMTDILNAETSLNEAQTAHTIALVQMKIAEIDYLKASGLLLQTMNL
jgi:outer membrane protein TolC